MAVGNDVVDLGDSAIATSHLRPRFVAKVLTGAERARFADAGEKKTFLWACFAAKEAAYKAVAQVRPPPGFAPHRFEVAGDFSSVRFDDLVLNCRVDVSEGRVHAVVWLGAEPELAGARRLGGSVDASRAARSELCRGLAAALGCPTGELAVERDRVASSWDGFGPPRVELRGRALDASVSLSHDGEFVAFAAQRGGCPQA